jgi:hypothetical protein
MARDSAVPYGSILSRRKYRDGSIAIEELPLARQGLHDRCMVDGAILREEPQWEIMKINKNAGFPQA